jgi:hypothetical protein
VGLIILPLCGKLMLHDPVRPVDGSFTVACKERSMIDELVFSGTETSPDRPLGFWDMDAPKGGVISILEKLSRVDTKKGSDPPFCGILPSNRPLLTLIEQDGGSVIQLNTCVATGN